MTLNAATDLADSDRKACGFPSYASYSPLHYPVAELYNKKLLLEISGKSD